MMVRLGLTAAISAVLITQHGTAAEAGRGATCRLLPDAPTGRLAQCRGAVRAGGPVLTFIFTGRRIGADRRVATKITVERPGTKGPMQIIDRPGWDIEVPGGEEKGALEFYDPKDLRFALADINFDGHADIRVFAAANQGCEFNHFWLYDPAKRRFGPKRDETTLPIAGLQCGDLRFDARKKEVSDRRQALRYHMVTVETVYRWRGATLERVRASVEVIAKSGRCRARLYRFANGKPKGTGFKDCPRDPDGGNQYSPPDGDLATAATFDKWMK
jgi:hypothetical protein